MPDSRRRLLLIFAAACVVGIFAGLFGIGGGVLLVPMLAFFFHYEQHRAQGTSLVALVPPTGLLAFLVYYRAHEVDVKAGLLLIPGIFLGGWMGGKLAAKLSPDRMRRVFGAMLLLLGIWQLVSPMLR
jgi:uncharacterized membrane protein YfcA